MTREETEAQAQRRDYLIHKTLAEVDAAIRMVHTAESKLLHAKLALTDEICLAYAE